MVTLSSQQRADFERDGFLILRGALSPAEVEKYTAVVDRLNHEVRAERGMDELATLEIRNSIALAPELLDLLDHPNVFPLVAEILGWNIQLTTSHVFVRMPNPDEAGSFKAIGWHTDGSFPTVGGVTPLMYAKIGYFLTDLSEPDRGNLRVIPGSQRSATRPELDPRTGEPKGAIQVLTQPGDAVLFENRCFHAVGPNHADLARKNIYLGYCYRWLKAIDFVTQSAALLKKATPIQRQLLGEAADPLSFYLPSRFPNDTPLKAWLDERGNPEEPFNQMS